MIKIRCYRFFSFFYIYGLYIHVLFFVWTIGLSDYRTVGLSNCRTVGLSDCRIIATAPEIYSVVIRYIGKPLNHYSFLISWDIGSFKAPGYGHYEVWIGKRGGSPFFRRTRFGQMDDVTSFKMDCTRTYWLWVALVYYQLFVRNLCGNARTSS